MRIVAVGVCHIVPSDVGEEEGANSQTKRAHDIAARLTTNSTLYRECRQKLSAAARDAATGWASRAHRLHAPQPASGVAARAGTGGTVRAK